MRALAAIPCYNERQAIGSVALLARKHVDEVLVIDDGSSDGTAEVAQAAGAGREEVGKATLL
jgi:glycosyltransferase involved in cell wall biosynthesis